LSAHIFSVFGGKSVEYRSHWHMRYKVPKTFYNNCCISIFRKIWYVGLMHDVVVTRRKNGEQRRG
jgi:hypothetical protein